MLGQVSASKIGTIEPFVLNPSPSPSASREAQLAAGLERLIPKPYPNRFAPATSLHADQTSVPHPSLELLLELLPGDIAKASYPTLAKIVDSLHHLQRTRQSQPSKPIQEYIDLMNWGALLPIYTNLDSPHLGERISEAYQLAHEARLISILDKVLENELFDLIANNTWIKLDPKNSLKSTLDFCIFKVAIYTSLPEPIASSDQTRRIH